MSWKRALAVAATSVAAAEVSKEKRLCIWSSEKHRQRQTAINNVASSLSTQRERSSSSSSSSTSSFSSSTSSKMASKRRDRSAAMRNQSEESLRTIMYLSCWGPN